MAENLVGELVTLRPVVDAATVFEQFGDSERCRPVCMALAVRYPFQRTLFDRWTQDGTMLLWDILDQSQKPCGIATRNTFRGVPSGAAWIATAEAPPHVIWDRVEEHDLRNDILLLLARDFFTRESKPQVFFHLFVAKKTAGALTESLEGIGFDRGLDYSSDVGFSMSRETFNAYYGDT